MKIVSLTEARRRLSALLMSGKAFTVTRRGAPVFVFAPGQNVIERRDAPLRLRRASLDAIVRNMRLARRLRRHRSAVEILREAREEL
jgi:antitoxin (DNA-binding transcriptional repressor) of toxin-antitoxin stability system